VILFGPYAQVGSPLKPGIMLGAVVAAPVGGAGAAGPGLGAAILDADGYYYVTPYLRFSAGSPPLEQTLQSGNWVTVTAIS
jgi:hypothetical protein